MDENVDSKRGPCGALLLGSGGSGVLRENLEGATRPGANGRLIHAEAQTQGMKREHQGNGDAPQRVKEGDVLFRMRIQDPVLPQSFQRK